MPFGLIFGSLFFGVLCSWMGLRLLAQPPAGAKVAGVCLLVLSLSLAAGLPLRRRWARWGGVLFAAALALFSFRRVAVDAGVLDHLLLFASLACAVLLLVPATGAAGPAPGRRAAAPGVGALGVVATAAFVGLLASGFWWASGEAGESPAALPASAIAKRVDWHDFGVGMERARAEGKPILATFVTEWCSYCSKMARKTWRSAAVVERLGELVPVRVDAEEARENHGYSGRQLAARYDVQGYPAQLLLDPAGRVLSRADGYQTSRELLAWLDRTLGQGGRPAAGAATRGVSR